MTAEQDEGRLADGGRELARQEKTNAEHTMAQGSFSKHEGLGQGVHGGDVHAGMLAGLLLGSH